MLEPVRMVKVSVVGPKEYLEKSSNTLYRLNGLHIEDYREEDEYFKIGEPLEKASKFSKLLVSVRSILSYAGVKDGYEPERIFSVSELDREVDVKVKELEEIINAKVSRIKEIEERLRKIGEERRALIPLKSLGIPPNLLTGYRNIEVFTGFVKSNPFERIVEVTKDFELLISEYDDEFVVAVFVKKESAEDVFRVLQEFAFREISVPEIDVDYDERLNQLESEEIKLKEELSGLRKELKRYEKENIDLLLASEEHIRIVLEKSALPLRVATSK